jgi:hypothetical protein
MKRHRVLLAIGFALAVATFASAAENITFTLLRSSRRRGGGVHSKCHRTRDN